MMAESAKGGPGRRIISVPLIQFLPQRLPSRRRRRHHL